VIEFDPDRSLTLARPPCPDASPARPIRTASSPTREQCDEQQRSLDLGRWDRRLDAGLRAGELRSSGNPIDVTGTAVHVAERMRVMGEIREAATGSTGMSFVNASGRRVGRINISAMRRATGSRDVELARADLAGILQRAASTHAEVLVGDSIAALTQSEDGVDVTFERAPRRRFDFVVGADGLHSKVRRWCSARIGIRAPSPVLCRNVARRRPPRSRPRCRHARRARQARHHLPDPRGSPGVLRLPQPELTDLDFRVELTRGARGGRRLLGVPVRRRVEPGDLGRIHPRRAAGARPRKLRARNRPRRCGAPQAGGAEGAIKGLMHP
jgi:2-polyprenyl-6-methoxyphenol hydroxylase-like FAD-dependent oxidoreductase